MQVLHKATFALILSFLNLYGLGEQIDIQFDLPEHYILRGGTIYTSFEDVHNGWLEIDSGRIIRIGAGTPPTTTHVIDLDTNWHLIPGMIEIHTHGTHGYDTMDATFESLDCIAKKLPEEGVTGFLLTTMTAQGSRIETVLDTASHYIHEDGAELLGINLEGPFISPEKAGMQETEYMQLPDSSLIRTWHVKSKESIKIVTLAPELEGAIDFIKDLTGLGIITSIGHSNAHYEEAQAALAAGASHATHLFNAMRPIHHRDPGVITALLEDPNATVELIADGVHVNLKLIDLVLRLKGSEKVILVTDSMQAKGLPDGIYDHGGQQVIVRNGVARLIKNGALASSTASMHENFKRLMNALPRLTVSDLVHMSSTNAAKLLNITDRKGSIATGKDADIVVLDENFDIVFTLCRGKMAYHASNTKLKNCIID